MRRNKECETKKLFYDYLAKAIRLEEEQWNCRDPAKLERILADVTAIKFEALDKLEHEQLRSDRAFSSSLCNALMSSTRFR